MSNTLTPADLARLRGAKDALENPGLAAKATDLLGTPIEKGFERLPARFREGVGAITQKALHRALGVAIKTLDSTSTAPSRDGLHKATVMLTGGIGGAFGLPALAVELPISTTVMLHSIAAIARSEGEDLTDVEVGLACIEVFALGGRSADDDGSDTGYYAARIALAKSLAEAAEYIAIKGVSKRGGPAVARFIATVAARFGITVSEKAAAMALPVVGAAGGALINTLFMDHYQSMARGHFTVRSLERVYGKEVVRLAYMEA